MFCNHPHDLIQYTAANPTAIMIAPICRNCPLGDSIIRAAAAFHLSGKPNKNKPSMTNTSAKAAHKSFINSLIVLSYSISMS